MVEIIVHYPWRRNIELERRVQSRFGLQGVRVLVSRDWSYEEMLQGLGTLSAEEFDKRLTPQSVVGVAWGTALYQVVRFISSHRFPSVEVVQMIGAIETEQRMNTDGPRLAQLLAERVGGFYRHLHAPLIIESKEAHHALLQERSIRETLGRAEEADIALIGIGSTHPQLYSILRAGYIDEKETNRIRAQGAVGDICGQHFDSEGNILDIDISNRAIAISLENLKKIPLIIGTAGGELKGEAILAALRGGYVNFLVTDESAAQWIENHG
jgi:DNA-binding transcriptional regulator LsrR (DeoR family)